MGEGTKRFARALVVGFGLTQLDDGNEGAVVITIGSLEITQFGPEDLEDLYRIRNDPSVREYMADPAPISHSAHVGWVNEHLVDSREILLLMVRLRGEAIGFRVVHRISSSKAMAVAFVPFGILLAMQAAGVFFDTMMGK